MPGRRTYPPARMQTLSRAAAGIVLGAIVLALLRHYLSGASRASAITEAIVFGVIMGAFMAWWYRR